MVNASLIITLHGSDCSRKLTSLAEIKLRLACTYQLVNKGPNSNEAVENIKIVGLAERYILSGAV